MSRNASQIMLDIQSSINQRYKAFDTDLDIYIKSWTRSNEGSAKKALANVARELQNFLKQRKGEIEKLSDTTRDKSPRNDQIRNFLLSAYLGEAIRDWDDIKQVGWQRDFYENRQGTLAFETIMKADQLASNTLQQALATNIVNDEVKAQQMTPICYFDKGSSIISAPYTNMPLVGVPVIATMADFRDIYAVLHEMGHYAYWHLNPNKRDFIKNQAESFRQPYDANEHTVYAWLEEVFADIFSSLTGGDEYNRQFRDFLLSRTGLSQDEFQQDDGEHPPVLIRPSVLEESVEWNALLDELKIEQNTLSEAKRQLKGLGNIIVSQLNDLTPLTDTPATIQTYKGQFVYANLKSFQPLTKLEDAAEELSNWNKDLIIIPWCC